MRNQEVLILLRLEKPEVSYLLSLPQGRGLNFMLTPQTFTDPEEQQDIRDKSLLGF